MKILVSSSLSQTLDNLNEAFFYNTSLSKSDRIQAAEWIASRRGKPGSYASMFAPTEKDFKNDIKLFTGEKVTSRAATGHILGEEACRALILLKPKDAEVRSALKRATAGILKALNSAGPSSRGFFCCGTCSASLFRHLAVGGLDKNEKRLVNGLKALKSYREGNGRWGRFPFFYTLLALNEIKLKQAIKEMQYAAPVCERYLKRTKPNNKYSVRRHDLCERVLVKC